MTPFSKTFHIYSFPNVFKMQISTIIYPVIFKDLAKSMHSPFMMYFFFDRSSQVTGLFCSMLCRSPSISHRKSSFQKCKTDWGPKKRNPLLPLRSIISLFPLTLIKEAESTLKDKHKKYIIMLVLFSPALVWRETCNSDWPCVSYITAGWNVFRRRKH